MMILGPIYVCFVMILSVLLSESSTTWMMIIYDKDKQKFINKLLYQTYLQTFDSCSSSTTRSSFFVWISVLFGCDRTNFSNWSCVIPIIIVCRFCQTFIFDSTLSAIYAALMSTEAHWDRKYQILLSAESCHQSTNTLVCCDWKNLAFCGATANRFEAISASMVFPSKWESGS